MIFLLFVSNAMATCDEPKMEVQVEDRQRIEGQVKASVATFGGSAGGSKDQTQTWQANLPSQSVLDNQWYLYLLCREYEAGRLPRQQYCEASGALWQRIVGQPLSVDGCATSASDSGSSVPESVAPEAAFAAPPANEPAALSGGPRRWATSAPELGALEVFGPLKISGQVVWYSTNEDCLTILEPSGSDYKETALGGLCRVWSSVRVTEGSSALQIEADGVLYELEPVSPSSSDEPSGTWRGAFYGGLMGHGLPVDIDFAADTVDVTWERSGCVSTWEPKTSGPSWWTFEEHISRGLCDTNGRVTIRRLSEDTVLMNWNKGVINTWGLARQR